VHKRAFSGIYADAVGSDMSKILVIEDEEHILELVSEFLRYEDYDVLCAQSGEAGLKLAGSEKPDVILCDVSMAGMDGHAVLRKLRSGSVNPKVPVIFLTGEMSPEEVAAGMELGANDYLGKPATRLEILTAIRRQLAAR
jgi:DNA-binding response OmpR family regulator